MLLLASYIVLDFSRLKSLSAKFVSDDACSTILDATERSRSPSDMYEWGRRQKQ